MPGPDGAPTPVRELEPYPIMQVVLDVEGRIAAADAWGQVHVSDDLGATWMTTDEDIVGHPRRPGSRVAEGHRQLIDRWYQGHPYFAEQRGSVVGSTGRMVVEGEGEAQTAAASEHAEQGDEDEGPDD